MNRHNDFRQAFGSLKFFFQNLNAHIVSVFVNVDEFNISAAIPAAISRRYKSNRRSPKKIPFTKINSPASNMKRGSSICNGNRIFHPAIIRNFFFKLFNSRTLRQKIGAQYIFYRFNIIFINILFAVVNHGNISLNSSTVRKCSFVPELYSKPSGTGTPFSPNALIL